MNFKLTKSNFLFFCQKKWTQNQNSKAQKIINTREQKYSVELDIQSLDELDLKHFISRYVFRCHQQKKLSSQENI